MAKILIVHHSGALGGAGVSLVNNLKALSNNHRVSVFVSNQPRWVMDLIEAECPNVETLSYGRRIGAITYYSGGDGLLSLRFWYRCLLIFVQMKYWNKEIDKLNPDIIIVNSLVLSWMGMLKVVKKRKSVCFVRETKRALWFSVVNLLTHRLLEQFSKVVFISEYDRSVENLRIASSDVVYNYVDALKLNNGVSRDSAEKALGLRQGTFRCLYVGGVSKLKGFDLAVDSVLNCEEDVELLVVGPGFDEVELSKSQRVHKFVRKMRRKLSEDVDGRIRMIGQQANMSNAYAASDVLLFPMREPHQARPAFEAGFFHLPVIITDFPNIKEFVVDGENGLVVQVGDSRALTAAIDYLNRESHIRRTMGENNYKRCMSNHDGMRNSAKVCEIIEGVVNENC